MKYARAFNFIYSGFIGDREVKLLPASPRGELKKMLKALGKVRISGEILLG